MTRPTLTRWVHDAVGVSRGAISNRNKLGQTTLAPVFQVCDAKFQREQFKLEVPSLVTKSADSA